jgi:hypothetical protein
MARSKGSRDTEKAFTERAIEATEALQVSNALVSPLVYVPRTLKAHQYRLTVDDLKITMQPEDIAENHARIAKADPLGFLIAAMNGQPLPEFRVQKDGTVRVNYTVLTVQERLDLAKWLGHKVTMKIPKGIDKMKKNNARHEALHEYDTIIQDAVEKAHAVREADDTD